MTKRDIEKCNNPEIIKKLCIEQYRTLFYISERLVDMSKGHTSTDKGIESIRKYLSDNDVMCNYILEDNNDNF